MKIVKPLYYIYCITNQINGKTYVGRSIHSSEERDRNYFGSGLAIKSAIKKYGKSNFVKEILVDNVKTKDKIFKLEEQYIKYYKDIGKAEYNLTLSSCGNPPDILNFKGKHHTEEHKQYISNKLKGIKREPKNDELRKRISNIMKVKSPFIYNNPSHNKPKWYTNGIADTFVPEGSQPEGYYRGRSKTRGKPTWNKGLKYSLKK